MSENKIKACITNYESVHSSQPDCLTCTWRVANREYLSQFIKSNF